MQYLVRRIFTVAILLVLSCSVNAVVIGTGDLSYDTDTDVITGTSGQTYLGWGVASDLNYEQTLEATAAGGIYEAYHIANQEEAAQFFLQATGTSEAYTDVAILDAAGAKRFGENNFSGELVGPASVAFFLDERSALFTGVGLMISEEENFIYTLDEIDLEYSDEFSATGAQANSPITWLLVSDADEVVSVPEPSSIGLLALGLFGLFRFRSRA